jgi:hypothetical protein
VQRWGGAMRPDGEGVPASWATVITDRDIVSELGRGGTTTANSEFRRSLRAVMGSTAGPVI